jgi:hypothetical protein
MARLIAPREIPDTWIPETSKEYGVFKYATQENEQLVREIRKHTQVHPGDLILDVGGRDGNVAFALQDPKWVDIVDPDPTVRLLQKPRMFWNKKVQEVEFDPGENYKIIIACHVLGYLGLQDVQEEIIQFLLSKLVDNGTLVLFYNTNQGYMRELLEYSRHIMPVVHHDYFDEGILGRLHSHKYTIKQLDTAFKVDHASFEDLARCIWILFGAFSSDIDGCARKFLPKLENDLIEPSFMIDERMTFVTKKPEATRYPSLG